MAFLGTRTSRSKLVVDQPFEDIGIIDLIRDTPIEGVRGNAHDFQVGLFDNADAAFDVSSIAALTLLIRDNHKDGSTVRAAKTVSIFDNTLDLVSWDNGSKQHAIFEFTDAEMNFDPGGPNRKYWMVITAVLASGATHTVAAGEYLHHEDNDASADPPPENPGTALTLSEALTMFVSFVGSQTLTSAEKIQVWENLGVNAYTSLALANAGEGVHNVLWYDTTLNKLRMTV